MPSTCALEPLRISEIPEVGALARAIWRQHYASIISSAQIEYMLRNKYTPMDLEPYVGAPDRWFDVLRVEELRPADFCEHLTQAKASSSWKKSMSWRVSAARATASCFSTARSHWLASSTARKCSCLSTAPTRVPSPPILGMGSWSGKVRSSTSAMVLSWTTTVMEKSLAA